MDKEKYMKVSDSFSRIMKNFFLTISEVLFREYGITLMVCGHVLYLHPEQGDVRASTFAMGCKEIILGIPDVLKEELNKYFDEIEAEFKKDIVDGFKILERNKKPYIH